MPSEPRRRPRRGLALAVALIVAVVGAVAITLGIAGAVKDARQDVFEHTTLTPVSSYATLAPPKRPSPATQGLDGESAPVAPSATPTSELRPGEDDLQFHTLNPRGGTDVPLTDAAHSTTWQWMLHGGAGPQPMLEGMDGAWACHDGQAHTDMGQLDWDKASQVTGAAVFVPSVCLVAPLTSSDAAQTEYGTQLLLPTAPWVSWYEQSAPIGSAHGTTYIAGHVVFYGGGGFAPFKQLEATPIGAPVVVRDTHGEFHLYEVKDSEAIPQTAARDDPRYSTDLFRRDGDPQLVLVTCLRGESGHYDTNRIVRAAPVTG